MCKCPSGVSHPLLYCYGRLSVNENVYIWKSIHHMLFLPDAWILYVKEGEKEFWCALLTTRWKNCKLQNLGGTVKQQKSFSMTCFHLSRLAMWLLYMWISQWQCWNHTMCSPNLHILEPLPVNHYKTYVVSAANPCNLHPLNWRICTGMEGESTAVGPLELKVCWLNSTSHPLFSLCRSRKISVGLAFAITQHYFCDVTLDLSIQCFQYTVHCITWENILRVFKMFWVKPQKC